MWKTLAQATENVTIAHVIIYAVAGLVLALTGGGAGAVIQRKRGNGKRSPSLQPGIDYVTPSQCERNHTVFASQQKELQTLRDAQAQERHDQTMGAIGKIEKSIEGVHQRIDELLKQGRKS